jgi:hypothetical protein
VGGRILLSGLKRDWGRGAISREVETEEDDFVLREMRRYYRCIFAREKGMLSNTIRLKKI